MSGHDKKPDELIDRDAGRSYWQSIDGDINGMLGGFSSITRIDLQGSRTFLARLGIGTQKDRRNKLTTLEGGAGIGRITEGLLANVSNHIDVIEPISKFTDVLQGKPGVRNIFNVGLEDWQPTAGVAYDLIWVQWCVGHLTDEQLSSFLSRAKTVLEPETGLIVVKENLSTSDEDVFDNTDSSVTRQDSSFLSIFEEAGVTLVRAELQKGWPDRPPNRLLPVKMYALRPAKG